MNLDVCDVIELEYCDTYLCVHFVQILFLPYLHLSPNFISWQHECSQHVGESQRWIREQGLHRCSVRWDCKKLGEKVQGAHQG